MSNQVEVDIPRLKEERRKKSEGPPVTGDRRKSLADRRMENNTQYATFYLGDHYIGIDVFQVQEILAPQIITLIPLAPAEIAGLINLRGQIITALDLKIKLGFSMTPVENSMNVVIKFKSGEVLSLLVDKVGDVLDVSPTLYEKTPSTVDPRLLNVSKGIFKTAKELLVIFDLEKIAEVSMTG